VVIGKAENMAIRASSPRQNGNTDEIAKAVAFVASDESSYMGGIELFVDGSHCQSKGQSAIGRLEAKTPVAAGGTQRGNTVRLGPRPWR
jgi:hypothetical protein